MYEDVIWRLVATLGIVGQLVAFASGWKHAYRVAGGAVSFTPALLLYACYLVASASGQSNPLPLWATLVFAFLTLGPLITGLVYLARVGLPGFPLWIGWTLNWLPLGVAGVMACCFQVRMF